MQRFTLADGREGHAPGSPRSLLEEWARRKIENGESVLTLIVQLERIAQRVAKGGFEPGTGGAPAYAREELRELRDTARISLAGDVRALRVPPGARDVV
jgi:hypothetical protein